MLAISFAERSSKARFSHFVCNIVGRTVVEEEGGTVWLTMVLTAENTEHSTMNGISTVLEFITESVNSKKGHTGIHNDTICSEIVPYSKLLIL